MEPLQIAFAVSTAIVLFLFGIEHFSKEVQAVSGERFRRSLAKGTSNRVAAFVLGAVVTAVIQSSTATSVIAVGLVNAGVMTFRQALGIVFGANVGTTVTAQLVALKLTSFAPALILVGFVIGFLPFKYRVFGRSIFYFGLVFFSLNLVSAAVEPLKENPDIRNLLASLDGNLTGVVVGALFTVIVQSSSVATGVAIVMLSQGAITFEQALPLIIGANVGTTATSLIASASLDTSARRTAMSHTLYNLGGALLFLPFLTPFGRLLLTLNLSPEGTLAAAHLAFNLVTAAIFLVFTEPFARFVIRLVPDDVAETEPIPPLTRAAFDENPDGAVRGFVATVVDAQQATYIASVLAIETRDASIANRASRGAAMVDFALEEVATLVRELSSGDPGPERSEAILRMVITIDHARQIQDSLADLRRIHDRFTEQHARLSIDGLLEVQAIYPVMARLLERLRDLLRRPEDDATMQAFNEAELAAEEAVQRSYRRFLEIVRKVDERGELADFLSIHQRLRTKVHAFARSLRNGHAAPGLSPAATALPSS
jgi:phosphate:Na+ symporter